MSEREAKCACLRVEYQPEDVEFDNPITGKPIAGKRDRWACVLCGAEFGRVLWQNAVVKDQQAHIDRLQAKLRAVGELPGNVRGKMDKWALRINVENGRMVPPKPYQDGEWITVRMAHKMITDELEALLK